MGWMINILGRLIVCVCVAPMQLCRCGTKMLLIALRKKRACFFGGAMRTHDDALLLYWELVTGGRKGIAVLGDLDPTSQRGGKN